MIFTDGTPPTNVRAKQTDLTTVLVTWTPPATPPSQGYQVLLTRGDENTTANVSGTSHNIPVNNQYGLYSVQVRSLSLHFPGEATSPVETSVRGMLLTLVRTTCTLPLYKFSLCTTDILPPVIDILYLSATTVTIHWTEPEVTPEVGTLSAYTISLAPLQEICTVKEMNSTTSPTTNNFTFTGLHEFFNYTITVLAEFSDPSSLAVELPTGNMHIVKSCLRLLSFPLYSQCKHSIGNNKCW